ncbi:MAG: hypothetical protein JWM48_2374, partial [Mycobacterium sp.]|nr:hypothetical protein [Mycobacterium sp.]
MATAAGAAAGTMPPSMVRPAAAACRAAGPPGSGG